jgi:hypothetical protein
MSDLPPDEPASEDLDLGVAPEHVHPLFGKTDFERWHHPRKQQIRIEQWCAPVKALIRERGMPAGSTFSYLTLPGDEMLDIRALNGVCADQNVQLKYLGFNSVGSGTPRQAELNLSQSEVRDLPGVNRFSTVLEERLEAISRPESTARRQMKQFGPFDAINIDLCGPLTERDIEDNRGSLLGVLGELLDTQMTTTSPWLLFITTMAQPTLITDRNLSGFQSAIDANVSASPEFAAELAHCISGSAESLGTRMEATWSQQDPDFLRLFSAGLGKWLLHLLGQSAPQRQLSLLSSYYYQVGPDGPDMLSLVFRCETAPQTVSDQHGILLPGPVAAPVSEVELGIDLARVLQGSSDLDLLLAENQELAEKRLKQAKTLLETARFSADAYEAWGREELRKKRVALGLEQVDA